MPPILLFIVVFVEGYCSLGAEVIALRRLVPHMGSAIVVTAPTIGLFLLALAWGYHSGGRVAADFRRVVARNFLAAAALTGIGLAGHTVDLLFGRLAAPLAYGLLTGGILCPVAWLLGQTVPILTNLMKAERAGEASGRALYWSTLGSFLGSVTLSLLVMQWIGVWASVAICGLLPVAGALACRPSGSGAWVLVLGLPVSAAVLGVNLADRGAAETAYADYSVEAVALDGRLDPRVFRINGSTASLIDGSRPPRYARYVERLRTILLDELGFRDRDILVLGAGGFTLSDGEPANRYTFVDIDPAIRALAESRFLGRPVRGEFIVADARRYAAEESRRFDAVAVDVFSDRASIPGHLVTREFWQSVRGRLKPGGVLLANLILDQHLASPYARNTLATMESVFGRCAVDVLQRDRPAANVIVTCFEDAGGDGAPAPRIYVDERNFSDWDRARGR
ncbi:MAG: fused MFS/spermidine synthase [Rhodocyclaceae bacterium]|nr:fused MFS/spermidine synthase [Rhodocyclaceae bacterium]